MGPVNLEREMMHRKTEQERDGDIPNLFLFCSVSVLFKRILASPVPGWGGLLQGRQRRDRTTLLAILIVKNFRPRCGDCEKSMLNEWEEARMGAYSSLFDFLQTSLPGDGEMKDESHVVRIVLGNLVVRLIDSIQRPRSLGNLILLRTSEVEKCIDQGLDSLEWPHHEVQQPP